MRRLRQSVAALMALGWAAIAQQRPAGFPAPAAPSQLPAAATTATVPATIPARRVTPGSVPAQRAVVLWDKGLLRVDAKNSSLNAILRDISVRTGMKIVGGVQDERVFGTYGPATAAVVLQQLLDGTRSNMTLQSDEAMLPLALTLTPLTGGPSPPNPMAAQEVEDEAPVPARAAFGTDPNRRLNGTQPDPSVESAPPPAQSAPDPQNSNGGVRTPQQIFEQLQRMRQQQQQPPQ
jgi:hypothetical protein